MKTIRVIHCELSALNAIMHRFASTAAVILAAAFLFAFPAGAVTLKVMKTGLGAGTITSNPAGIDCGATCDGTYSSPVFITLTAIPAAGSAFSGWSGDCSGMICTVTMSADRSLRAEFSLTPAIPALTSFTPSGIQTYLTANPSVNSAARFIKALPAEFKQNWILMSRSESLQTGTANSPRILLPSADAQNVFTVGMMLHSSYPGAHPSAVEFMQWDAAAKNFRFHEIVLENIPAMGNIPPRMRGVSTDDSKCSKCHSTRNVLNRGTTPGTSDNSPGNAKNKPNWDSYDSWGGMMPFNRDRLYQGSVEIAAFRKIFNPWTWRTNDLVRSIIEQLELQPPCSPPAPCVPPAHVITRTNGGTYDGHVDFPFDVSPPVLTEPAPSGTSPAITTSYSFDGAAGTGSATSVTRGGSFITLHHSAIQASDEGRGVHFFDLLGGLYGNLNQTRIADEIARHRFATGSVPIDVRPISLAITKGCLSVSGNTITSTPPISTSILAFIQARNGGMTIADVVNDTALRAQSVPRRKADIQKLNFDRTGDPYLFSAASSLMQEYGSATSAGPYTSMDLSRLRQEVFRRPLEAFPSDSTVMGGIYVDRESYAFNTNRIALYRYLLEPLGISVDKWSMGVRGRSRTYSFADVFSTYTDPFVIGLQASLTSDPIPGLSAPFDCAPLINAANTTLSLLPPANDVPTYTDVQRIFNKSCIECHGGLGYPPYYATGTLDFSENEAPPMTERRMTRSHRNATSSAEMTMGPVMDPPTNSLLYSKITSTNETCPGGLMPCGGPPLSKVDIETIRRWIVGGSPYTEGDPHLKAIDGTPYDFQAVGEFVLLRGEDLEIQTRQSAVSTEGPLGPNQHTGLTSCVSLNTAVAVRFGTHRITYQPNPNAEGAPGSLELRIDGNPVRIPARGVALPTGERILQTSALGGIQIEALGGTGVIITPAFWDYYRVRYMNVDTRNARAIEGLIGSIAPGNWLPALPNGSFLGPRPAGLPERYQQLYGKFGNSWRVTDATTLFDYAAGTSTKTFTDESWPGNSPKSCVRPQQKAPQKTLPLEEATKRCGGIVDEGRRGNCLQDVMVTGEVGFAKTYLLTEQIQRKRVPSPPVLVSPEDNQADLTNSVTVTWKKAPDVDGKALTYRTCMWIAGQVPTPNDCDAVASPGWSWGILYTGWVVLVLVGFFLLTLLIWLGTERKILKLVTAAILAAVILAYFIGQIRPLSTTVARLESSTAYLWKVIAEDAHGVRVESETRRFTVK
jgi:hypothetical protein